MTLLVVFTAVMSQTPDKSLPTILFNLFLNNLQTCHQYPTHPLKILLILISSPKQSHNSRRRQTLSICRRNLLANDARGAPNFTSEFTILQNHSAALTFPNAQNHFFAQRDKIRFALNNAPAETTAWEDIPEGDREE